MSALGTHDNPLLDDQCPDCVGGGELLGQFDHPIDDPRLRRVACSFCGGRWVQLRPQYRDEAAA